jgi:DTW domain-containing protein YfiP
MDRSEADSSDSEQAEKPCSRCERTPRYCVCAFTQPLQVKTKVLVLQHPQEPGVDIGTVPIIRSLLPSAVIRTGLSWPNLRKALGEETSAQSWGVLYLGSVHVEELPKDRKLFVVDKKGLPVPNQDAELKKLQGIVLLDGTWSQAKTLWWRNAWLLKLRRLVVNSQTRSLYDRIRKEPRKGCLSTLETAGEVLEALDAREDIIPAITKPLQELVTRLSKNPRPQARGRRSSTTHRWRRR